MRRMHTDNICVRSRYASLMFAEMLIVVGTEMRITRKYGKNLLVFISEHFSPVYSCWHGIAPAFLS